MKFARTILGLGLAGVLAGCGNSDSFVVSAPSTTTLPLTAVLRSIDGSGNTTADLLDQNRHLENFDNLGDLLGLDGVLRGGAHVWLAIEAQVII